MIFVKSVEYKIIPLLFFEDKVASFRVLLRGTCKSLNYVISCSLCSFASDVTDEPHLGPAL